MKKILFVISLLLLLIVLLHSCKKEEEISDYLPLKVGAIYKYNYLASYTYVYESSLTKGECIWTFIRKSVDTPVVYQVEQSFTGYYLYDYYTGRHDSTHYENQITTLNFEILNDGTVTVTFPVPYWGDSKVIIKRLLQSDEIDICYTLEPIINSVCLRKDVGITKLSYWSCGNHCSSVCYSLIEGPFY